MCIYLEYIKLIYPWNFYDFHSKLQTNAYLYIEENIEAKTI